MLFCPSEPLFSALSSTKSRFLCAFALRNPCFRAFRAQNRGFCALLPFGTPIFGRFEHKIGVFVRFCQQVSSRCCRSSSLHGTQCRVSRGAATLPHRLPLRSMDCRCSDIASLSAHLHRLPTPPAYLRRMRLQPGRRVGVRCQMMLPHRGECAEGDVPPENAPRETALWERTQGDVPPGNAPRENALWERATGNVPPENATKGTCSPGTHCWERNEGNAPPGNALCGEYYSPALRRSAFSATWSWSITS